MKEALSSSETSALTRATRRNILEDAILHSHRREKPQILHTQSMPLLEVERPKFLSHAEQMTKLWIFMCLV
jgi:hypothetical protein